MTSIIRNYFQFEKLNTNFKQETVAGVTSFFTVAYIVIVNPKILEAAGIPVGPSMVATIIAAIFGTLAMGLYARRPFVIAPYMGENAFVAFTVVTVLGYSWQAALGAIFIGGVLFVLFTVLGIRAWLARGIPESLKIAFAVGIGLFLTFIGMNYTGLVVLGTEGAPVHVGNLHDPAVILSVFCFLLIGFLMIRKVNGALLIGILVTTVIAYILNVTRLPQELVSLPPDISPIFMQLDIRGALTWGFFPIILTVFVMDFVDTAGTLLGLAYKSGFLAEDGNLPQIEKPLLCDAAATVVGAISGTTTTGTMLESAAGIQAGGRSGFASVVTAIMFALTLFFAPFLTAVPACAYGAALIAVGLLMMSPITRLDFGDLTEAIPAFLVIIFMCFTYNLGIGMTAGFVAYPMVKLFSGRVREIHVGMWILAGLSALFFIFYPY